METIEILFKSETNFDHKSILNKLNKHIDKNILDQIESGITLEQLDNFNNSGIPILKYKTQITIHGLFPELSINSIFGYKNLFQNKNKSIGIKYNAIDEEKRQRIAKRLKTIGFYYRRNSQGTEFNIMEIINKDNFESLKIKFIGLSKNIDQSLYVGHYSMYIGQSFGVKYLCFDLYINAIYEKNIELFLNKIGATIELLQIAENKKQLEETEYKKVLEAERLNTQLLRETAYKNKSEEIAILEQYTKVEKTNLPGMYIQRSFDYNNNFVFKVVYIYLLKGKQKPRWNKTEYISVFDALNHECKDHWNDSIFASKLSGYLITQPEIKEVKPKIENKTISNDLQLINYSDKSIAIIGNTKAVKDDLKAIGGRFNFHLTCGPGWIFPVTKLTEIQNKFNLEIK